jgi:hypothetical protein
MSDTPLNQETYPQPSKQRPGCGFPVMRIVGIFCLGTGVLTDLAKGALHVGERTLFRSLWHVLEPDDIVLADRGFCGFADFHLMLRRGIDCVMRNHANRTPGKCVLRRHCRRDRIVNWHRGKAAPSWLSRDEWNDVPRHMAVREIDIHIEEKGFRTRSLVVVTTLLDARRYPASAIAELYRRRWRAELFLRDIKGTMGMDILRCKSPAMVHKELTMHMIAYNLVRSLMLDAARKHSSSLERMSFKGAVSIMRQWAPLLTQASERARHALQRALLRYLAHDSHPDRPGRREPRAVKRRPKPYQLMTRPRHEFTECPHRSRYRKTLS